MSLHRRITHLMCHVDKKIVHLQRLNTQKASSSEKNSELINHKCSLILKLTISNWFDIKMKQNWISSVRRNNRYVFREKQYLFNKKSGFFLGANKNIVNKASIWIWFGIETNHFILFLIYEEINLIEQVKKILFRKYWKRERFVSVR